MSYNPVPKLTNGNATFDNDVNVSGLSTAGSGLLLVDLVPASTTNKLYNDGGTLKFNGSSIGGGGGGSYDDTAISGYFESRVDSADSSITANSGYFESRVDTNAADIITVSGLTGGGGGSYTTGSGLTLVGSEFNVYGGSGNFEYVELTTDSAVVPTFKYQGSGVTDTAINLEVISSFQSATGSGTALLFQGTQGQLFSITDNLSSGTIFNVSDITGLPMLEVTASGDVEIGEFADNITIHQPVLLSGGVPSNTTNKLYNNSGTLYFNGSALGAGGGGGLPYSSGDYYLQEIRSNSASGVSISGALQPQITQNASDIATVSGLLYDDAAISGYFESRVDAADTEIASVSGYAEDYTDSNLLQAIGVSGVEVSLAGTTAYFSAGSLSGYFESRVDSADVGIATVSGLLYDDAAISGYFESRVDSADTNISTNSSNITANSGYFESRVDQNAADIITVSGLTGGSSYTAGSGLTLVGTEFNVYGGSGNFENIDLTTDAAVVPKMVFTGSGVTDTPIRMKVLSSHASASTSGTALAFEGTEGQLFGITDNLSSGKIFSVNDITGLPLISADASGDVELAEFGRDIIAHKAITLQSGVPSVTTNKLYNDGGTLKFNGSTVGGGGISNVVEDTTPQLGGDLDAQTNTITFTNGNVLLGDSNTQTRDAASYNIMIGGDAGTSALGNHNIGIGYQAVGISVAGNNDDYNIGIGYQAAASIDGDFNVCIGSQAGLNAGGFYAGSQRRPQKNVFLGYEAGRGALGNNNIEITNYNAGDSRLADQNFNDYLNIGHTIFADMSNRRVNIGLIGSLSSWTVNTEAALLVRPTATTDIGVLVEGISSHSASLQEWQNSSSTKLVAIGPDGGVELPDNAPSTTTNKLYNDGGTLKFNGSAVGGGSYTAGSGLTLAGTEFNVYGGSGHFIDLKLETSGIGDLLTLISTDDSSSSAPVICTMRDSASPADGDYLGQLKFKGRSDTGVERVYAKISGKTLDVTNGTEDGLIEFAVRANGSQEIISRIRNDGWRIVNDNNLYIQDNGSLGVRVDPTYSLHVKDDAYIGSGVTLPDVVPAVTTNKLYNNGGTLTFNGSAVGGASLTAGSGITIDGADQINVHGGSGHFINLDVEGAFTATTKSFLIDHPSKEGMKLQYASLEGPENGVYVRGTTDSGTITLPDYWRDLVHNDSITVTLTPVGQFQPLFVEEKSNREIRVGGVSGHYDYVVYGERKDVNKLEVEW
jgi:hypothetical protein